MPELHADLLAMHPLDTLEAIRKLIHVEDYIVVKSDRDTSLVQLFWDHHDGEILELTGEECDTLTDAVISFNVAWIEQERQSERRRAEGVGDAACALSILPGYIRDHMRAISGGTS